MIFIVLPAYDEESALPLLLADIRATMEAEGAEYKVIVVDDGSSDGTSSAARAAAHGIPLTLIRHPVNRGLSEALRTGFLEAGKHSFPTDVVVTMDSDNTHPPALIPRMVEMIREDRDVVIASRFRKGAKVVGVPFHRRVLSRFAACLFKLLFPIRGVRDYTSGYRAYRASLLRRMFSVYGDGFIDRPGFSCTADILLKVRRHPCVAGEVPLVLRYDRKGGDSKMKVMATVLESLGLIGARLVGKR